VGERVMRAVAKYKLTLAEYGALEALGREGPMLLGELQRRLLVSSGGITYLIDRLVERGLVARHVHPEDRRARFASLTQEGERLLSRIEPEHDQAVADAVDGLTSQEQRQMAGLLRRLGIRPAGVAASRKATEAEAPPAVEPESAPPMGIARILVVDDDARTHDVVRSRLGAEGREILVARSAAEAEATLAHHEIALIILGLVLPDADGRIVYASLSRRKATAGIPVIMIATGVGDQIKAECLGLGVTRWLEKPLDPAALLDVAEAVLSSQSRPQAALLDPVSGAASRAAFTDAYERDVRSQPADAPSSAIALIDWDSLAAVNAAYGEEEGNAILRQARETLSGVLRDDDTLARWREDEFVALFPRTPPAPVARLLTRAQAALASAPPRNADGVEVAITFSVGIAAVTALTSLDEAVATADSALSRAKAGGPSRVATAGEETPATPVAVLVAEDDRVTATLVRHRLQRTGFEVVHTDNGIDALAAAEAGEFGLFVSDIRMPGLDGFELVKRLRAIPRYATTPILMLTNLGREEDVVRAFNLGVSDYMTKPFSPVELLARVQRLLRRRVSSNAAE
jgi:diguanylate cyclase (GGDEF)-like protein